MKRDAHIGSDFNTVLSDEMQKDPKFRAFIVETREKLALAKRLKELRIREGYTQEQLASMAGVAQAYIARLEPGPTSPSRMPSIDAYVKLLNILGYETTFKVKKYRTAA